MTSTYCDVAIVGAGPYGLSTAAHLRAAGMTDVVVLGRPMSFWIGNMPVGMLLRSPYVASHIDDPDGRFSLDAYQAVTGTHVDTPVPLERFVDYGRWVGQQVAPDLDERHVARIDRDAKGGFQVQLEDGDHVRARRVVVAGGIAPFAHRPHQFRDLPDELAFHASERRDLSGYGGRRVLVVGGGQSALESAALLYEAGATVHITVRSPGVHWLGQKPWLRSLGPVSTLLYAPQEVGPPLLCQLVAVPHFFRRVPRRLQDRLHVRSIRPAGAGWLRPRVVDGVSILTGMAVAEAVAAGDGVTVTFSDGTRAAFDHVLLGTGYRVDVSRYPFLPPELLTQIRRVNGYPVLSRHLESTTPGLHFVGAPAAWSFGPLMRFVAGTPFTSAALTRGLLGVQGVTGRGRLRQLSRAA